MKMMLRNDINVLRRLGLKNNSIRIGFDKELRFHRKAQIIQENQAFSLRRAF